MSLKSLLANDTATLQRPDLTTRDGAGAVIRSSWSTVATKVPVRVSSASGSQVAAFAQQQIAISHVVYCMTAGPRNGDRFQASNGRYFLIVGESPRNAIGGIPSYTAWPCQEVKQ